MVYSKFINFLDLLLKFTSYRTSYGVACQATVHLNGSKINSLNDQDEAQKSSESVINLKNLLGNLYINKTYHLQTVGL